VSSSSSENGHRPPDPDDPPEIYYNDLPGSSRRRVSVGRTSIREVYRDRREEQEFYVRIHISPRAAAILASSVVLFSHLVEGMLIYLLR
jgi:hypothetical protein